jgi:ribosomal protein S18 acetylase RimI-like enzyme
MSIVSQAVHALRPQFRLMEASDVSNSQVLTFSCGSAEWEEAIARFLRSGEAWHKHGAQGKTTLIYVSTVGPETILGYAHLERNRLRLEPDDASRVPALYIARFGVSENHHRQGHGRRMMEQIKTYYTAGVNLIHLHVDARNGPAIAFYQGFGFRNYTTTSEPFPRMILPLP